MEFLDCRTWDREDIQCALDQRWYNVEILGEKDFYICLPVYITSYMPNDFYQPLEPTR